MRPPSRNHWLVIAVVVLAVETLAGALSHRDAATIADAAQAGPAPDRVFALYVQASRDEPRPLSESEVRSLLASDEPLVREWVMTPNFRRVTRNASVQNQWLARRPDTPETRRSRFFLERGAGRWMTLAEFRSFLSDLDPDRELDQGRDRHQDRHRVGERDRDQDRHQVRERDRDRE